MADIEIIVNIEGLDELERTLTEGGRKSVKRFLRAVEKKAARVLQAAAEENAPVETGVLAESIKIASRISGDQLTVSVGPSPDAFYGMFQEFGTEFQPAQHWLSMSFEDAKEEALDTFIREAAASLEEMAKK
jgi:HK97 gp10 family phage protein